MKQLILILLFPLLTHAQFEHDNSYFTISTEVDGINMINKGNNINGYNGVFNVAYRSHKMQMHVSYETFPNRAFQSYGAGGSYVFNYESPFNILLGSTASLIYRQFDQERRGHRGHDPSVALNLQVEYHTNTFLIYIRNELRYRGDLKVIYKDDTPYINSVFFGIGYKI